MQRQRSDQALRPQEAEANYPVNRQIQRSRSRFNSTPFITTSTRHREQLAAWPDPHGHLCPQHSPLRQGQVTHL